MITAKTPKFRVSYPAVMKPRLNKLKGKEEYSVECLFPKGQDLSALKKAVQQAIIEKWGTDKSKWPKNVPQMLEPGEKGCPFKKQDDKEKDGVMPDGYEKGAIFLRLNSTRKPGVVDGSLSPITEESEFYGGCYARASVTVYAYDQAGNRGVSFGLVNLQKMADGEAFSGITRAEDDFEAIEETNVSTDTSFVGSDEASADSLFG